MVLAPFLIVGFVIALPYGQKRDRTRLFNDHDVMGSSLSIWAAQGTAVCVQLTLGRPPASSAVAVAVAVAADIGSWDARLLWAGAFTSAAAGNGDVLVRSCLPRLSSIIRNILHGHDPESEVRMTQPSDVASRENPGQVSISFIEAGTSRHQEPD